ncbi:MAG: hypothetical protein ACYDCO_01015 [Armatimonadota bacterium]
MGVSRDRVNAVIGGWPEQPRQRVEQLIAKYGDPNEVSETQVTWYDNGPWKRTVVYRQSIPHHFPKSHEDFLAQTILYHVPPEKMDELSRFDGSVIIDRTAGEATARCDAEAANFLALNLMNDIVTGKRSVEDARQEYTMSIMAHMMKRKAPLTEELRFQVPSGRTNDPDESTITESLKQQAKEKLDEWFGGGEKAA